MKDNRLEQRIQHSLNAELSGLNTTSCQRNQFFENATGGTKVKRKLTYSLVLAIVLLLIAATALAASIFWRKDIESVFQYQNSYGHYVNNWGINEKLMLIDIMEKNEVSMDPRDLSTARDRSASLLNRQDAADRILTKRYGFGGYLDTVTPRSIMETEMGKSYYDWSIEDKAWYSDLEWKYTDHDFESWKCVVPKEGELTQEEALEIARSKAKSEGLDLEMLDQNNLRISYLYYPCLNPPMGEPYWSFYWSDKKNDEIIRIEITWKGEVVTVSKGDYTDLWDDYYCDVMDHKDEMIEKKSAMWKWTLADWQQVNPAIYRIQADDEITPESALELARAALIQEGLTAEELDNRGPSIRLQKYPLRDASVQYEYAIFFTLLDQDQTTVLPLYDSYVRLDPKTGSIRELHINPRKKNVVEATTRSESINGFRTEEEIRSAKGEPELWTLEERAFFLSGQGIPDPELHISESDAIRLARYGWDSTGHTAEDMKDVRIATFFYTDESKYGMPYWEIRWYRQKEDGNIETVYLSHILADINLFNPDVPDAYHKPIG
ncbi:MAG: hypothetical protein IKG87_15590 [Clostridia bacterium]|nr:hypothetical protein [Clostridia bacterium]